MQNNNHSSHQSAKKKVLPKRIIIVRHGESEGNLDTSAYSKTPDYKISLTEEGRAQARLAGSHLRDLISGNGSRPDWRVYFYVSPYERTRSTLREIGKSFSKKRVIGVREECRIRGQDFGNFQVEERMKVIKETREKVREGGEYSLAMNHTDEEMLEWGLSPDMIQDQKWRITGKKTDWNDHCTWYLRSFFDELDSKDDVESN
ncbi:Phosphoglycerate mutase-like protein AT74H [Hibiscus syriacus]|uniref:Phosphoglycerate mutase-like protein AT74H n=1 Tax=Hibiscus syriacus TaxID=106335 RepID=A0A6A3CG94_HIBSY|nr:Phosphoglycerate mutase-like protein AT74H [Hibiscus syriacus]